MWSFRKGIRVSYQDSYVLLYSARQSDFVYMLNPQKAVLLTLYMKTGKEECLKIYKRLGAPETEYERIHLRYGKLMVPDENGENAIQLYRILEMKNGAGGFRRTSFPVVIQWIATYKCGFNCIYCGVHRREPSSREERVGIAHIQRAFKEAVQKGARVFYIHGGDPLFQYGEGLYDLVQYLRDNDCDVNISTKGYITKEIAKRLKSVKMRYLQISVDTYDNVVEKELYPGLKPSLYQMALQSIMHLIEVDIIPIVNIVITEYNYAQIPQLVTELLKNENIQNISLSWYQKSINNMSDLQATPNHKSWLIKAMHNICANNSGRLFFDMNRGILPEAKERVVCANGRFKFLIFPDGKCGVCDFINQDDRRGYRHAELCFRAEAGRVH